MTADVDVRAADLRELMDDPTCDPRRLRRTLRRFGIVNRVVAGWGAVYARHIAPVLHQRRGLIRILDIGCGGGDVLRGVVARARREGHTVAGVGIDPDERCLAVARETPTPGVRFERAYASDLVARMTDAAGSNHDGRFDVVLSNHLVHHLSPAERAGLWEDSTALSRGIVLHSDIARSRAAYALYAVGITPLAPGSFLRVDGLRSIRRSFTPGELAADVPAGWRVETPTTFRVLAHWSAL